MCRMVVFSGTCVRCGAYYTVPELEQNVSCLEAKNNGRFGDCSKGIMMDEHDPAFECAACGLLADEQHEPTHHHHHRQNDMVLVAANSIGASPGASSNSSSNNSSPRSCRTSHSHRHASGNSGSKSKSLSKGKGSSSSSSSGSYDPMKRRRVW